MDLPIRTAESTGSPRPPEDTPIPMPTVTPSRKKRRRKPATADRVQSPGGPSAEQTAAPANAAPPASPPSAPWYRTTLSLAALGAILLWAAFPPCGFWFLAWFAPVPWLWLVRRREALGRREYGAVYLVGFLHWMLLLQGMRLAHWATHVGWVAVCLYLAVYLPVFVGLTRVAVHRMRVPLIVAAPVIWVGLEYVRAFLFTGMAIGLLGHTQVHWLWLIQASDLMGAYTVSLVVMLVAACVARMWPTADPPGRVVLWPIIPAVGVLAATLAYGAIRVHETPPSTAGSRPVRVALIQESIDTQFDNDRTRPLRTYMRYLTKSQEAIAKYENLDLVIWPETVFGMPLPSFDKDAPVPPHWDMTQDEFERWQREIEMEFQERMTLTVRDTIQAPAIIGTGSSHLGKDKPRDYNSALHVNRQGQVVGRYDKMHPVIFGEYVPLGNVFPWLYQLTPMDHGLTAGERPEAFEIAGLKWSVCICFENTVPHLVRRQIVQLADEGRRPDVLVTLTNDGWFWGSSILDLHLMCGVFRAVEHRTPMLIAANTGFSAWIDGNGQVRRKGPRRAPGIVLAAVQPDRRWSPYTAWGDWPVAACLVFCAVVAGFGVCGQIQVRRREMATR
jgi:apolipoprotein N-acyltransferase